ncbi:RICIN domain-containing protein [Actinomadura rayongensis]|uniref:Ricin B lectin domain-containing protein n=1 Tax=Actinomadura rayongensis TaxID=1429076 RepID=A0A6I4WHN8_9ACTN|nr:RICIN domain-containing protein [Actinomadura rayongensis]MXQ67835.1 hypothetical protein [Actinomadura rayongensis]
MLTRTRCLTAVAGAGILLSVAHPASASVGGGNVSIGWSIPGTPAQGLTNITFPIAANPATDPRGGTFFAQQYNFQHNVMGYIGLQPRADKNGKQRLDAHFSLFGDGASTTDANCHPGADNGGGVTCATEFDAVYGHTYDLTVTRTATDTWTGTATDTVTGAKTHIGTYKVPAGSGTLTGGQAGFVEYFAGVPSCAEMPRADVTFGGPTSTDAGGLTGTTKAGKEYSDCVGKGDYRAVQVGNGVRLTRGFLSTRDTLIYKATAGGRCMDASGDGDGSAIVAYDCHGNQNQRWRPQSDRTLRSLGQCLDVRGASTADGTPIILWPCHGRPNQQWTFKDGALIGTGSGKCADVGSGNRGTALVIRTCNGSSGQKWSTLPGSAAV